MAARYHRCQKLTRTLLTSEGNPDPKKFPSYMVQESNFRSEILRQILEANKKFSFDDWRRAAFDTRVLGADKHLLIEAERPFDITIRGGPDVHYYDLAALISSPDAGVLVAEFDSKVVASGYAKIDTSEPYLKHRQHSYLGFMYVVPEHRGKGVIKQFIAALEEWSRSRGVTELQLEVSARIRRR